MRLEIDSEVSIRVWETSAETRYIVFPMRPEGTADWNVDQLATLITREAIIGVAVATKP